MTDYSYYFHRSGRIERQPAASDEDIAELVRLARRIADTTGAAAGAEALRAVVSAFTDSCEDNSLRCDGDLTALRSVRSEVECYLADILWPELIARASEVSSV